MGDYCAIGFITMEKMSRGPRPPERSQGLDRGLRLIEAISRRPRRVTDLSRDLGIERRALSRLLESLSTQGFVRRFGDGRIGVGPALLLLAREITQQHQNLAAVTRDILDEVCARTSCTTILHEVAGERLVPQLILAPRDVLAVQYPPGRTIGLWEGIGRAALLGRSAAEIAKAIAHSSRSDIDELIRQTMAQRAATSFGEITEGITAVGAPVRDGSAQVFGVLAIVAPAGVHPELHVEYVRDAAERISRRLGAESTLQPGESPSPEA
jgi:DNA-binding IclR family transcriptional regulator